MVKNYFWQWDTGQKIPVTEKKVNYVHFANTKSTEALVLAVVDGEVDVPNILLQQPYAITAFGYVQEDGKGETLTAAVYRVIPRPKPEDYVYVETETEGSHYSSLEQRIENLEDELAQIVALDLQQTLAQMQSAIDDLQYVEIDITSVSNNVGTVELGTRVTSVTISWAMNKDPVSQTVNGEAVEASARSKALSGLSITGTTAIKVTATDERGATDEGSTTITFLNGVYYGALAYGADIDSAAVLSLTRKLQSSKTLTFTVSADGERPVYALPTRYGTPTFKIGGFEYEWEKVSSFQFTNASGYTEIYDVWMHGQDVTGSITVNAT